MVKRILVVDDVPSNLKLIAGMLSGDYNINVVTMGKDALKIALSEKPDLILLDVFMPDMDGIDVYHRLKADKECNEIPVIFHSAGAVSEDIEQELLLGRAFHLLKPAKRNDLLSIISSILSD